MCLLMLAPPKHDKQELNYTVYVVNSRVFLLESENAFEILSASAGS